MPRFLTLFLLSGCVTEVGLHSQDDAKTEPDTPDPDPDPDPTIGEPTPDSADTGTIPAVETFETLIDVAFFQSVQVVVVEQSIGVPRNAPLIVDRDAIVRVKLDVPTDWAPAEVELAVDIIAGGVTQTFAVSEEVSASSVSTDPESGLIVSIPADAMVAQADYVVRLTADSTEIARYPTTGDTPLDAMTTGPLKVELVPFEVAGFVPVTSAAVVEGYRSALMAMYPVTDVVITVGDVVSMTGASNLSVLGTRLGEIQEAAMFAQEEDWDVYYYGMVTGVATRAEFTMGEDSYEDGGGGTLNRAYHAVGPAFADQHAEDLFLHAMGHVHQLGHAPCDNPGDLDPNYPYANGTMGVEGYDNRTATFVPPNSPSMMTFCNDRWISDYGYTIVANQVAAAQFYQGP